MKDLMRVARATCRRCQWTVVAVLALVAAVCGYVGLALWFNDPRSVYYGKALTGWDYLYSTLQLFTLESFDALVDVNAPLEVARFLAPAVTAAAAIKAVGVLLGRHLGRLWLRRWRGHAVICGLGDKGLRLATECLEAGIRAVVIDQRAPHPRAARIEDLGGVVLQGNGLDASVLRMARIREARLLFAVCGHDGDNLAIALRARSLVLETQPAGAGPHVRCFAHVGDVAQVARAAGLKLNGETDRRFELTLFNIPCEAAAIQLLHDYPPDGVVAPSTPIRLLVVGFGRLGQAVVLHALHLCHYAEDRAVDITVLAEDARQAEAAFRQAYPALPQVPNIRVSFQEMPGDGQAFLPGAGGARSVAVTQAIVCTEAAVPDAVAAFNLDALLPDPCTPILVYAPGWDNEARPVPVGPLRGAVGDRLIPFGGAARLCTLENVMHPQRETVARAIHAAYLVGELDAGSGARGTPNAIPWSQLPEDIRESNRLQADHLDVKLRAVGCILRQTRDSISPAEARWPSLSDDELEMLARMEHNRWMAEKLLAGWTVGRERNDKEKRHDALMPWDSLPEKERAKDRAAVRHMPACLARIGKEIVRQA